MKVFLTTVLMGIGLFSSLYLLAADSFEDLKKGVVESPYTFTSEISVEREVKLGTRVFLTNRVSRGRFQVAGKPVKIFFRRPQTVEAIGGLKASLHRVNSSNNYVYQDLTDEKGEMIISFIPPEGRQEMDIYFVSVPQNTTEHINRISFQVFDPVELNKAFLVFPILWLGFFAVSTFIALWKYYYAGFLPVFLKNFIIPWELFPYLSVFLPISRKKFFLQIVIMTTIGLAAAWLLDQTPLIVLSILLIGLWFFREKSVPCLMITGMILSFQLFLHRYYALESISRYIGSQEIGYLLLLSLLAASPAITAGLMVSVFLQNFKINPDYYPFVGFGGVSGSWMGEGLSFAKFTTLPQGFLVKDSWYLFLLSLILTGFIAIYYWFKKYSMINDLNLAESASAEIKPSGGDRSNE